MPELKEFCFNEDIGYNYFMNLCAENEILDEARKRCLMKKEVVLAKLLYRKQGNAAGIIFSLKQLGWRENPELVVNNNVSVSASTEDTVSEIKQNLDKLTDEEREMYFALCDKIDDKDSEEE